MTLKTTLKAACFGLTLFPVFGALTTGAALAQIEMPAVDIPYERFTLDNGLTVVVHEDRKAPVVAVAVWYGVGSRDEPAGKTGFAHLFEHLMFNGTEHYDGEWFEPLEEVGATGLNGTTNVDRTNYFQTVPTAALERVLWMESDRMGHLLGAVTQDKLDEQRGVVQNEKRQGENQPYGRQIFTRIQEALFPAGHPYRHSTIGSMEDLDAASLEDVQQWFKEYYGAANAVIVLSGDINAAEARPLMEKYFGHIQSGPAVSRLEDWVPERTYNQRDLIEEPKGPQPRIYRVWALPGNEDRDVYEAQLATQVLAGGRTSRLYKELVYDRQIATQVFPFNVQWELATIGGYVVQLKPDVDLNEATRIIDQIHSEFLEEGPTRAELQREQTSLAANTIRGLEQVGGFGGKSVTLAGGQLFHSDPGHWKTELQWLTSATPNQVQGAARRWLDDGMYQLDVVPFKEVQSSASEVDRSTGLPGVGETTGLTFPEVEEATLRNGTKVVLARRDTVPVVNMRVVFDAGYAADAASGAKLGTASFAAAMLAEGTENRSALELSEETEGLGINWGSGATLDTSTVTMSALKSNLAESIDILADVIQNPAFDPEEIERYRGRLLQQIEQEKSQPQTIAFRLLPPIVYGEDHPYGVPLTGSGTTESVTAMTRDDLVSFHNTWMRPDNATILVAGDTTMDEILPIMNRAFRGWDAPSSAIPEKNVGEVQGGASGKVILIDQKGSPQSVILAGHTAPAMAAMEEVVVDTVNRVFGGSFTARLNMNLREDKGWSYGARTLLLDARGPRPWLILAPVQTDRTIDSIKETQRELSEYLGGNPATDVELQRAVLNNTRRLPGQYETANAVLGSLTSSLTYGRSWDYPTTLPEKYGSLTTGQIAEAAGEVIRPGDLTWVIIGDLEKIEEGVRALNLGAVEVRDVEGNILR